MLVTFGFWLKSEKKDVIQAKRGRTIESGTSQSGTFGGSNILEPGSNILEPQNFIFNILERNEEKKL